MYFFFLIFLKKIWSPYVIVSFFSKVFLELTDFMGPVAIVLSIFIYYELTFDKMSHAKFLMFPMPNDPNLLTSIANKCKNLIYASFI